MCFADGIRRFGIAATENLWGFKMACHSDVFLCKESGPMHQYVYSLGPEYAEVAKTKKGQDPEPGNAHTPHDKPWPNMYPVQQGFFDVCMQPPWACRWEMPGVHQKDIKLQVCRH